MVADILKEKEKAESRAKEADAEAKGRADGQVNFLRIFFDISSIFLRQFPPILAILSHGYSSSIIYIIIVIIEVARRWSGELSSNFLRISSTSPPIPTIFSHGYRSNHIYHHCDNL